MTITNQAIADLVTEVLDGTPPGATGTWFVQGDEALRATLDDVSSVEASTSLGPSINTIAAHVFHAAYYLELALDGMRGIQRDGDWDGSWTSQTVSDAEWQSAKSNLAANITEFRNAIADYNLANEQDDLTYAIANVGHLAYHLGSIRQLFLVIKSRQATVN